MRDPERTHINEVLKGKPKRETQEVPAYDAQNNAIMDKDGNHVMQSKEVAVAGNVAVVAVKLVSHNEGKTQFGNYIEYIGNIQSRRLSDGKIFQGPRYIPTPVADFVLWNIYSAAKAQDAGAVIETVLMIGVEPDARSKDGYKWTCTPVLTPEQTAQVLDPFADMFARVEAAGVKIPGLLPKSEAGRLADENAAKAAAIGDDNAKKAK